MVVDNRRLLVGLMFLAAAGSVLHVRAEEKAASGDWSVFRGPTGMGVSTSTGLPTSWSENEQLVWKTKLPGAGSSSPIVWKDHIYLTCYSGYLVPHEDRGSLDKLTRHLISLSREDGKLLWNRPVPIPIPQWSTIQPTITWLLPLTWVPMRAATPMKPVPHRQMIHRRHRPILTPHRVTVR